MMKVSREGSGIVFTGVVVTLAILGTVAISRSFSTSNLASSVQAEVLGAPCEALVLSAVQEMEAKVRDALTRPDQAITRLLCEPVVGAGDGAIDVSEHVIPQETRELQEQPGYQGATLAGTSAKVLIQKCLDGLPYERVGVLAFTAHAESKIMPRAVRRTLEVARAFKVVLPGPPRPFDQYGLFMGNMGALTDLSTVNGSRDRLIQLLDEYRRTLDDATRTTPGEDRERVLDLLDAIPDRASADRGAPPFPSDGKGMFYGLCPNGAEIDLANLDLSNRLRSAISRAESEIPRLTSGGTAGLAQRARPLGDAISDAIWSIWAYREAFNILSPDAPEGYRETQAYVRKLDEAYFARRAFYRLGPEDRGQGSLTRRFSDLAGSGPFRGIIHVPAQDEVLTISGKLSCQLLVAVGKGGVTLDGVTLDGAPGARLTVACFGGRITIRGSCEAHVIAGRDTSIVMDQKSVLKGGLTMVENCLGTRLEGTIIRSEAYYAGVAGTKGEEVSPSYTFVVGLSPRILYRRLTRS